MRAAIAVPIVEALAGSQLGLVASHQLRTCGITRDDVARLNALGVITPVRPAVYRLFGSTSTADAEVLAAVLACGEHAFAIDATAAFMHDVSFPGVGRDAPEPPRPHHVVVFLDRCPRPHDVVIHRSRLIEERDVTVIRGVPCATAERLIVDVSSRLTDDDLGLLIDSALRRRATTLARIRFASERLRRAPGRSPKRIARVLARRIPGAELAESPLEEFVYDSIVRFGLRRPTPQHWVEVDGARYRIDHCYPESKYAIETQSRLWHGQRSDEDRDALKGNDVAIAGFKLLQFTASYTDWGIAEAVARAIGEPVPPRPAHELTYAEWCAHHRV